MRLLLRRVVTIILLLVPIITRGQAVDIIPTPKYAEFKTDKYYLSTPIKINIDSESLRPIVDYIGGYVPVSKYKGWCDLKLNIDTKLDGEVYRLTINSAGISIAGGSYGGQIGRAHV